MNRQLSAWDELLKAATAPDYDDMQDAMFQVALILERHNYPARIAVELYEEYLSRDLLRLTLDDQHQSQAIDFLVAMVRARREDADTFLYALGKCKPVLLAKPLVLLMLEQASKWTTDARLEACTALNNVLRVPDEAITALLRMYDPSPILDVWSDHSDEALADQADRVLEKIEQLLGRDAS